jgi:sugar/nucleoside kinase (ribokinase family)
MPKIIAIGEALVEIMRPDKGTPLDQAGLFEGPYASGAPAIFAVAAARLGLDSGFVGSVGQDGFGRLLAARLGDEKVDIQCLHEISGYTTGIAFIAYAADGGREFVFHLRQSAAALLSAERINATYFAGVSWLHISGSALFLSEKSREACARALALTKAAGGKLSLDPNLRPELMAIEQAREVLAPFVAAADLLLPTAEEAHILASGEDDDGAAAALIQDPRQVVVFKRGAAGASVFTGDCRFDIPGYAVEEVDPTGAGDCFNAGFIYGLEAGWPAARAGVFACAAGALAVTRRGPMEGAPFGEQVKEFLRSSGKTGGRE